MKILTIRRRIMLWYTTLLVLILVSALPLMYFVLSNNLYNDTKTLLHSEIDEVTKTLVFDDATIQLDDNLDLVEAGTYVAVYSKDNVLLSGKLPPDFNLRAQPVLGSIYLEESDGHKWMIYDCSIAQNGETSGWLRAVKSLGSVDETLNNFQTTIYIIIPVYIAIALFGGFFIKRTLSPVVRIARTAKQIGQGDLSKRIHLSHSHDEFGILAESFDQMLDRLEDSFNREKRFSSDVSHELRTPITAIILSAEEALDGNKEPEEYKESLGAILKESRKMNSLISQLLMMARSHDGKYAPEMEEIDISMLTQTIVDEVSERSEYPDVSILIEIEDGITMLVEQTLYMRLLINLIDNALKYNIPGGWVKVTLASSENAVYLSVEDSGIGISKENLPKIWDRFFKADQSSINSSPGLGLSIVKWIAELHGGTVHVNSKLNKGSLFEIRFQLK